MQTAMLIAYTKISLGGGQRGQQKSPYSNHRRQQDEGPGRSKWVLQRVLSNGAAVTGLILLGTVLLGAISDEIEVPDLRTVH